METELRMSGLTAAEHRAAALQCIQRADDSWDRSDTDGFLSQWASTISSQVHNLAAEILDNGGMAEFVGLFTLDGRRVAAVVVDGKYGLCWKLLTRAGGCAGFVGAFPARPSTLAKKGYREEMEWATAFATSQGANAVSVCAVKVRTDGGYPKDDPNLYYVGE